MTDFGLSRFGLLGRQARTINRSTSHLGKRLKPAVSRSTTGGGSGQSTPDSQPRASYFNSLFLEDADAMSESSGSESVAERQKRSSRVPSTGISIDSSASRLQAPTASPGKNSETHRFVGTVDVSCLRLKCSSLLVADQTSPTVCSSGEYPWCRGRRGR